MLMLLLPGCGSSEHATEVTVRATPVSNKAPNPEPAAELSSGQAKKALTGLPYHYRFRRVPLPKGATAAFAGSVTGADKTHFQFGVALGASADPIALPRSGTGHATFVPSAGFTYTTDVIIETRPNEYHYAPNLRTMKQLNLAVRMEANMQRALCLAATGKQCGI